MMLTRMGQGTYIEREQPERALRDALGVLRFLWAPHESFL